MTQKSLLTRLGETIDQYRITKTKHTTTSKLGPIIRWLMPNGGTLLIALLLIMTQSVWARSELFPTGVSTNTISYQGRLADTGGNPITGFQNMEFRLYDVPIGGSPLWEEFWTGGNSVQVSDGLFNVMLGSLNSDLTSVVQGNTQLYLGVTVGTDSEMSPRVQLGSVPFSMQALTVPDGSISGDKLAATGFGASDEPLLNFVPVSPRIPVLEVLDSGTTDWTTLDLSQWLPPGAQAVLLYGYARDANSATNQTEIRFDNYGVREGVFVIHPQAPNNRAHSEQGIVTLDSDRRLEYKILASGADTFRTEMLIVGYFEVANR
jgi:hypothetical protein